MQLARLTLIFQVDGAANRHQYYHQYYYLRDRIRHLVYVIS